MEKHGLSPFCERSAASESMTLNLFNDTHEALRAKPSREDSRPLLSALSLCQRVSDETPRSVLWIR